MELALAVANNKLMRLEHAPRRASIGPAEVSAPYTRAFLSCALKSTQGARSFGMLARHNKPGFVPLDENDEPATDAENIGRVRLQVTITMPE